MIATGGSGGHVYPVIAVIKAVQSLATQTSKEVEMEIVGSSPFFAQAAQEITIPIRRTLDAKARQYFSIWNFADALKLPIIFFQSLFYVWRFMPDIMLAKGSYASFLPALVARMFFIPVYIHESDSVPGRANTSVARWAKKIFISFSSSASYFDHPAAAGKTQLVGDPIRTELLVGDRTQALNNFQLIDGKPVLLVAGGSQGAQKINELVKESLVELINKFQIIHQCGEGNYKIVNDSVQQLIKEGSSAHLFSTIGESYGKKIQDQYRLRPFLNLSELTAAYAAADVIVSRAGAANLFEIAALGKPGVIIPITNSNGDHQRSNALEFGKFGGTVLEEQNLTPQLFIRSIEEAYNNRVQVGEKIKGFAKPEAAELIAKELLK